VEGWRLLAKVERGKPRPGKTTSPGLTQLPARLKLDKRTSMEAQRIGHPWRAWVRNAGATGGRRYARPPTSVFLRQGVERRPPRRLRLHYSARVEDHARHRAGGAKMTLNQIVAAAPLCECLRRSRG
jgi:hypothetical protein